MKNKIRNTVNTSRNAYKPTESDAPPVKIGQKMGSNSEVRQSSVLLSKLVTQHKIKENFDHREYRIITGSDDGYIFFWNIPHNLVIEAKNYHRNMVSQVQSNQRMKSSYKIPEIKPKHELILSGYA